MKTFKNGNWSNDSKCVLCNTSSKGEVTLIPKIGTQEGNIIEAVQVHTECLGNRLIYDENNGVIYAFNKTSQDG